MLVAGPGCTRLVAGYTAFDAAPNGVTITVRTDDVEPYREDGVESGTKLSITLQIRSDLVRRASERFPGTSSGYAVYVPAKDGIWRARELAVTRDGASATAVPIVAAWSRTGGGYAPVSADTAATRERLAVLDRYPCRDLRLRILVDARGYTHLRQFLPPKVRSTGPPCLSTATFEARGFHAEE